MKKLLILPLVLSILTLTAFSSSPVFNWGLNPNTKAQTPEPPKGGAELLKKYNSLFIADETQKTVYLTFDLGYEAGHTGAVLDILKTNNIKAIFLLCGNYLKETELITRMITDGHTIGNHTNHHKDLVKLSHTDMKRDISEFTDMFSAKHPNHTLKHFRPPSGRFNEAVLKEVQSQNMKTIMWSGAIKDWGKSPIDATANANRVTSRIHPGAILLFHITNSGMPKMLELLIPQIMEKGYTFGDAGKL